MYNLEYLPIARQDLIEIVTYISQDLQNPAAANRLAEEIVQAAEKLQLFPYAWPVYLPIRPLQWEYRKLLVQNFLLFYRVDEENKLVTVARVLYARSEYKKQLE